VPPLDQLPEIRTHLFIDGETRATDDSLQVVDPVDGVSVVGYAAAASAKLAEEAVSAAHRAFPGWAARRPQERAELLTAALAPLEADRPATAEVLTRENGKIRMESFVDSIVFAHRFGLATALVDEVDRVVELPAPPLRTVVSYLPLGVVTIIVPFNWPLAILAASLPQALLAGNTVVVKPPPSCPLATVRTVQQVAALLPPGVLNVVTGTDAEVGPALIQDDRVKKVCFTGSPGGGKRIMAMASESLTRVALELGGNDPALVLADAVLDDDAFGRSPPPRTAWTGRARSSPGWAPRWSTPAPTRRWPASSATPRSTTSPRAGHRS
jgi:acyl-CoA reductase-like NAD-dependent aldehyde dehydrogenase